MAGPDKNDPGLRIVQCAKVASADLLALARAHFGIVNQLVKEVLTEVPDADFIEIRAIRIDVKEGKDERPAGPAHPGTDTN